MSISCRRCSVSVVWLLALAFLYPLIIASCGQTTVPTPTVARATETGPEIGDGGLLSGEPCGPPCFWHIIPGKTTEQDALQIIKDSTDPGVCAMSDTRNAGGDRGINCHTFGVTFDDAGHVAYVGFAPGKVITMGQMLAKYGKPDAQRVTLSSATKQPPDLIMLVFYDRYGLTLFLPDQKSVEKYAVSSETAVPEVEYADAISFARMKAYAHPWSGFGQYEMRIP